MPKLWDLTPPNLQSRVMNPLLADATPIEIANEIYDVLGGVLGDQIPVTQGVATYGPVTIDSSGLRVFNQGLNTIRLDNDGDAFFGADLDDPAHTTLIIFSNDQDYNAEDFEEGDLLIGDNSSSRANMFWDRSAGTLQFRGGTTMRVQIATDGSLEAGAGNLTLDTDGITFGNTSQWSSQTTIDWKDGTSHVANIQGFLSSGDPHLILEANRLRDYALAARVGLAARGETDGTDDAVLTMNASTAAGTPGIDLSAGGTGGAYNIRPTIHVWNDDGADVDYRWEGANNANLFNLDAGTDSVSVDGFFGFAGISELTISGGVVTATRSFHTIDTESDAGTDDLDTINGGVSGDRLVLQSVIITRDPTLKDGTGNLRLAGDFTLTSTEDRIELMHDGTNWIELSRSNNG